MWISEKTRRITVLGYIVIGVIMLLVLRLAWLQLLQGPQYKRVADENRIRRITAQAPRGSYLPGVIIEVVPVRYYPYKQLSSHVLGFVGRISEEYAARKSQGYHPNDLVGKDGLEREWENFLRGQDGGREVEVNALGEEVGVIPVVRKVLEAYFGLATTPRPPTPAPGHTD